MFESRHTAARGLTHAALLLALALALVACDSGGAVVDPSAGSKAALPSSVATVNGREIPTRLYEMYLKNAREEFGLDETTEEGRRQLDAVREGIVSELIDRELISQEVERRGLPVPAERLAEAERRAVAQLGGEERFRQYLAEHGLTREDYLEVVKKQLHGELLREELKKGLSVSDDEVKKYYEANKGEESFRQPERVTASHVLVAARPNLISQEIERERSLQGEQLQRAVREEMERRRRRAEEIRQRALKGADFAALARELSDDPGTRAQGGNLGSFARNSHPAAFDEAAFRLKPGELGPVVRTDFGFHVIKVTAREPARTLTLEEATPEIRRRLLGPKEAETLKSWLSEARRSADVRVAEPFRLGALKNEFPKS